MARLSGRGSAAGRWGATGYHAQRARADARRDRELERLGWRVLRVEAAVVQHRLGEAVAVIRAALADGG